MMVAIDLVAKSMASRLVTNIFQNIFFCVQQKKETLEQFEGE